MSSMRGDDAPNGLGSTELQRRWGGLDVEELHNDDAPCNIPRARSRPQGDATDSKKRERIQGQRTLRTWDEHRSIPLTIEMFTRRTPPANIKSRGGERRGPWPPRSARNLVTFTKAGGSGREAESETAEEVRASQLLCPGSHLWLGCHHHLAQPPFPAPCALRIDA
ncbi:hypothetical protein B0H19DRAFT_1083522 [Mycena capillaripes]|nr:hypothetical protein B0H19DRAFT_1083522 [Mycena capillaripes]